MNLFQTQERLNSLPPTPQTIQYLSAAVEGQNPNVPPWLALVRMQEVQKEIQQNQQTEQGQPPTVKDQVQQASGIMTLQQQQQQAAMQNLVRQASQAPQAGIAAVAPQAAPAPDQAGIAAVAPQGYRHGGAVRHFQYGGSTGLSEPESDPLAEYRQMLRERQERAKQAYDEERQQRETIRQVAAQPVSVSEDPNVVRRREYAGMGVQDPAAMYDEQMRRAQGLEQRMREEDARRAQERERMNQQGFFGSLIQGREATRGARGSGLAALMSGYGAAQMGADQAATAERRQSEAELFKRQADINALMAGVGARRMGTAEQFAESGISHAGEKAKAEGARQTRMFGAEKEILGDTSARSLELERARGDLGGRLASAEGTRQTALIQGITAQRNLLQNQLGDVAKELNRLQTQRESITKTPMASTVRDEQLRDIKTREDAANNMRTEILRKLQELERRVPGGGSSVPSPGVGGASAPATSGGTIPYNQAGRAAMDWEARRNAAR